MAKKFLVPIDMAKGEIWNAAFQNLGAAPTLPVKGQMYFNTGDNTLYWWDGTAWASARGGGTGFPGFGAVTQEQTFGATKNDGVGTTTARADHTHGNPVHDNAAHAAINLSALAAPTAALNINNQLLNNVATPVAGTDAVNKNYADNLTAGLSWKEAARAALTTNRALTGLTAVDGVTPSANDRILLMGQTAPAENGLWLAQSGAWTRPTDYDAASEAEGAAVFVLEGTANGDKAFVNTTNAPITIGTTGTVWVQFGASTAYTAGAGLTLTGSTLDVGTGTGITVAADTVSLDTTYTDGRYVNVTGDTMTGTLVSPGINGPAANADLLLQPQGGTTVLGSTAKVATANSIGLTLQGTDQWDFGPTVSFRLGATDRASIALNPTSLYITAFGATNDVIIDATREVKFRIQPPGDSASLKLGSTAVTSALPVVLPADPTTALQAATKQYVDARVPATRTLTAGAGLTGGGDLSANRTFDVVAGDTTLTVAADSIVVNTAVIATVASLASYTPTTRTITSGNGLTGGGDLSANRTLDVGAGIGITVAADTVAFDTTFGDARYALAAAGVKRFAANCAAATSTAVAHNFGTKDVVTSVYRVASPFDDVECDVEHTDTNTVTVRFTTAPAAGDYRIVVMG